MPETILIVDDEISQLRMAEFVVKEKLRYQTVTASGGQEAINHVVTGKGVPPDLILLDLVMPKVGGLEVIRAVRAIKPQLPIIVFTQYGDQDNAVRAVQAGANDFLNKPVVLERLRLSIQNALAMQRMKQYLEKLEKALPASSEMVGVTESPPMFLDASGRLKKLRTLEAEAIRFALTHCDGSMTRAARNLGIGRSTLYRKISDYGIDAHNVRENQTMRPIIYTSLAERS